MSTPAPRPPVGIGVFGRLPRPGAGKTRLAAAVGADRAARLAAAFLGDVLDRARLVAPAGTWWWIAPEAGRADADLLAEARAGGLAPDGVRLAVQRGAHLGERMAHALAVLLAEGPAMLVGSDVPDVPVPFLERAAAALARPAREPRAHAAARRLVLGPARDGGFYLVGCDAPPGELLAGRDAWGDAGVLARTLDDAARAGWDVERLEPWDDVDTAADLARLAARLADTRARGAAAGADWPRRTADALRGGDQGADAPPVGG